VPERKGQYVFSSSRAESPLPAPPHVERVCGVRCVSLPRFSDSRGALFVGEVGANLPFTPRRFFFIDAPAEATRGSHAHREAHQMLVCLQGCCAVLADDGVNSAEYVLTSPDQGLYLPPRTWSVQHYGAPHNLLLVLASDVYDPADYVNDYEEFLRLTRQPRRAG